MNKKTITLRIDGTSKIIILLLGAGLWAFALKPLGPNNSYAQNDVLFNIQLAVVELAENSKKISSNTFNINKELERITERMPRN
jgi:hypothetical protein